MIRIAAITVALATSAPAFAFTQERLQNRLKHMPSVCAQEKQRQSNAECYMTTGGKRVYELTGENRRNWLRVATSKIREREQAAEKARKERESRDFKNNRVQTPERGVLHRNSGSRTR